MRKPIRYILESVALFGGIIAFTLVAIYIEDHQPKQVNPLNKYDSITAKLPVEEKVVDFNDKPTRVYYDKDGILTKEF